MSNRSKSYIYRPIRRAAAAAPPPITPATAPGRLLWLDAAIGVDARGAAGFSAAAQSCLLLDDNPSIRAGDVDFAIAVRFRLDRLPTASEEFCIVGKDSDTPANARDYTLIVAENAKLRFYLNGGGPGLMAESAAPLEAGTWYLALGWHDAAGDTVNLRIGGAAPVSTAIGGVVPHASAAQFRIGARQYAGFEAYCDGRVDQAAFFKVPPGGISGVIGAIGDRLSNGGSGLPYGGLGAGEAADWGLVSWWDLDESTGIRRDRHGANHLTPVNSPTLAEGLVEGPAADGAPALRWVDRIGGLTFSEPTVAGRPTYRAGGLLDFDAEGRLSKAGATVGDRPEFTLLAGVRVEAPPSSGEAVIYCEEDAAGAVRFRVAVTPAGAIAATYLPSGGPSATITSTAPLPTDRPAVVAVRRAAGALSLFLDGAASGSGAIAPGSDLSGASSRIGAPVSASGGGLGGRIAQLFAVDRALTDSQVASLSDSLAG